MGYCVKLCALMLAGCLMCGCAATNPAGTAEPEVVADLEPEPESPPLSETAAGEQLLKKAHTAIGTPYVFGGTTLKGFDCSGFVRWAYDSIGVRLPRTAREQSVVGQKIERIEEMQPGDIVAFNHPKRGYHTGIYIGDGKFIHSPRKRTTVRINSLSDSYFSKTLLGARRVDMSGAQDLVAQAQTRLGQYAEQRQKQRTVASKSSKKSSVKTTTVAKKSSPARTASKKSATKVASKSSGAKTAKKSAPASKKTTVVAKKTTKSTTSSKTRNGKNVATRPVKRINTKTVASRKPASGQPARSVSMLNSKK